MLFDLPTDLRDIIWYHVKQMREEEERLMILNMEWKLYVWLYKVNQRIMEAAIVQCGGGRDLV
jgi:hypothetical protein